MNKLKSLSIFFPCYNDAGTIASLVILADKTAKELTDDYEIIVIDDGSHDASLEVLQLLKRKFKKFRVINHKQNKGYGAVLKSGFKQSHKEWIFYTDGDFQYDVRELVNLVQVINNKTSLVQGYKKKRNDPWYRLVIGYFYNNFVKILFNLPFKDIDCDFRLIKKNLFKDIKIESNTGAVCVEMMLKFVQNGINYKEVPVNHYPRPYQRSQFFNFRPLFETIFSLIKVYWYYKVRK